MIRVVAQGLGQTQEECIRDAQLVLAQKGYIPFLKIDGTWNKETSYALQTLYGASWDQDPGGPCAIAKRLSTPNSTPNRSSAAYQNAAAAAWAPPIPPTSEFSISPLWVMGGAAALLALLLVVRK